MAIYREEGPRVLRYLRARAADLTEAEDLHAETFCRAWHAWPRFRGQDTEVRGWLFRIAKNLLVDRIRRRRRLWFIPLEPDHSSPDASDAFSRVTDKAMLTEALRRLSEAERELVALRLAGLSHAEIGQILGRSEPAVKIAWHRIIARLRGQLQKVNDAG